MDSIIWAFRHTERNIAETGLNLLLEMLKNFQVGKLFELYSGFLFYRMIVLILLKDMALAKDISKLVLS
jgi:exportin-1